MADDPEDDIRRLVAERIDLASLVLMYQDQDWVVRYRVAERALPDLLEKMRHDPEPDVRALVEARLADLLNS